MWMALSAYAGSLDQIEVGGVFGTPNATDGTALWWNPAGLAAGHGTRFNLEGAPLFATVTINRDNPNYPEDPTAVMNDPNYNYGGQALYERTGVVPFAGVVTDFGVPGLGVGIGLAVPMVRGAKSVTEDNILGHHLLDGNNQAAYAMLGAAYEVNDMFAFGATGSLVATEYNADLYTETMSSLEDGLQAQLPRDTAYYSDTMLENSHYRTRVAADKPLSDTAFTFGVGLRFKPKDWISLSLAYQHGVRVENTGTATLAFDCPTTDDIFGRLGSERGGICHSTLTATEAVAYNLPGRVQGGVQVRPHPKLVLEVMGAWVNWSTFTDYEIAINVDEDSIPAETQALRAETKELVSLNKNWARDNTDSVWFAVDGKFDVHERLTLGARVLFDQSAVPTDVLSINNYDATTIGVTAMGAVTLTKNFQVGVSVGQYFGEKRTITDSKWGMTVDPTQRKDERYFYPEINGTFESTITRLALQIRGQFDHGKSKPEPKSEQVWTASHRVK